MAAAFAVAASVLILAGCGGDKGEATPPTETVPAETGAPQETAPPTTAPAEATGEPIKVGAISSITGPIPFPESTAAVQAVFDRVNAEGGINGRPLEYLAEDDKADPALAGQASRRLVEEEGVVALVGSASLLECSVNAQYYGEQNILSIQGTGVDPVCFLAPNISPVNTGPYLGITVGLYFASEVLKDEKICAIMFSVAGLDEAVKAAVDRWSQITGKEITFFDISLQPTDDPTPLAIRAKQKGCDAIVHNGLEPHGIAWAKALKTQGLDPAKDVDEISLTSMYTEKLAEELGKAGIDGFYANSEFEPYLGDSPVLDDWRSLMAEAGVPPTSFAEGGYLAATIFVDVLKGIDGEITRESVTQALRALEGYESPLLGTPYSFGDAPTHNPNQASKFVRVEGGKWEVATPDWLILPSS